MKAKICHITSVHPRFDSRIFYKECTSLQSNGFDVHLIVADGKQDQIVNHINIWDVAKTETSMSRLRRILFIPSKIRTKIDELKPSIIHFHDPELMPLALKLQRDGYKVIGDFHEDVPLQILTKPYLNKFFRLLLSKTIKVYQNYVVKKLSKIVTATPTILTKLRVKKSNGIVICNYPTSIFQSEKKVAPKKGICYIGGISYERGFYHASQAATKANVNLTFIGTIHGDDSNFFNTIKRFSKNVNYQGVLSVKEVPNFLNGFSAGLVTLLPIQSYIDAFPIKLFEYMQAGIPVIASNFPIFKSIIEENDCGICVDPENPTEIANAMKFFNENSQEVIRMGENGRKAINKYYNWGNEEKKLITLYRELLC